MRKPLIVLLVFAAGFIVGFGGGRKLEKRESTGALRQARDETFHLRSALAKSQSTVEQLETHLCVKTFEFCPSSEGDPLIREKQTEWIPLEGGERGEEGQHTFRRGKGEGPR